MATDKILFLFSSLCITVGIVFSLSLPVFTVLYFDYSQLHFFARQLVVGLFSIYLMWQISRFNPDIIFHTMGFFIFFSCLFLMGIMHFLPSNVVTSVGGAKRWIRLPGFSFAPVEFFKIGFVYFLAWSFSRKLDDEKKSLFEEFMLILPYVVLFLVVIYLIAIMQNDLGQVVVLALTLAFMAFFAGTSLNFFIVFICGSMMAFAYIIISSTHRIERIKSWWGGVQDLVLGVLPASLANTLRVENTPEPYQISHSLNAFKHGGLFGEGFGDGLFKLGYLSEVHTDFVLAGIAEEMGAFGVLFISFAILVIIFRVFKISSRSKNRIFYLFSLGIGLLIVFSFLINAYGVTSLVPIKGIAVPFLSYGGSSLVALSIGIGMVLMVSKRADL